MNNQCGVELVGKSGGPNLVARDDDRAKGRGDGGRSDLRLWCGVGTCNSCCEEGGDMLEVMHVGLVADGDDQAVGINLWFFLRLDCLALVGLMQTRGRHPSIYLALKRYNTLCCACDLPASPN